MIIDKNKKQVLLICPFFFDYHKQKKMGLESMGYEVILWNDRCSESTAYKFILRMLPRIGEWFSFSYYRRLLNQTNPELISHILIVKGEALSPKFVTLLSKVCQNASMSFHLYDSAKNLPRALVKAKLVQRVSTFDPDDAEKYGWIYRPLFASPSFLSMGTSPKGDEWDLCFIGTVHSDRFKIIQNIKNNYSSMLRIYTYCFVPSKLILYFKRVFFQEFRDASKQAFSLGKISTKEVARIVLNSVAVLDIEHKGQSGLTMRTIETLLAGKKLVTTNEAISKCNLYDASRVQIINRNHPVLDMDFFQKGFKPISPEIFDSYTIQSWLRDVTNLPS